MKYTKFLIGIDDTDNLESRGTGYRARGLGVLLAEKTLAEVTGISRHQLLVDPRIPYTSHNSSLCLAVKASAEHIDEITTVCRDFLARESAVGSDAGLCIAARTKIPPAVVAYGARAKLEVLNQRLACEIAERAGLSLIGITGDHGGIIGALAAVGLRAAENDGRFVWLPGVRELSGVMSAETLYRHTAVDEIRSLDGRPVAGHERIDTSPWPRPVLIDGRAILLVQQAEVNNEDIDWHLAPRDFIRRY